MNDEIRITNDELPKWDFVRLADLTVKVGSGSTPRGGEASYQTTGVPLIRSMNVVFFGFKRRGLAFINENQAKALDSATVRGGDVLLNITGASIGRVTLAPMDMDGARVNQHVCIIRPSPAIDARYLNAFLSGPTMQQFIFGENYGVTRQALTKQQILDFEIPLAPLPEQKRIADKLDAVLTRVDACRARLDRVPALLKRFRQSVLASAVSGKLTEEWREANECGEDAASLLERMARERRAVHVKQGRNRKYREAEPVASEELPEIPATWRWTNFDHCSSEISVGHVGPMKNRYVDKGVAFLRCQNVRPLRFNPHGLVCIPTGFHKELSKSELRGGEILVVRSGANTGDCCVFPCGFGEANCSDLVITRPLSGLISEYGAIYVNSPTGQSLLDQKQAGVAQPHFNIGAMRVKAFPLAPFAEQQEIVRRVEDLFAFADRIEARLATAQKTVERLTPATLAKAFRGELVPQDPNDEPASALLERLPGQPVAKPAKAKHIKRATRQKS